MIYVGFGHTELAPVDFAELSPVDFAGKLGQTQASENSRPRHRFWFFVLVVCRD